MEKYTKEQYEELINNSPLFDVDKERDSALYESERDKFLDLLARYCRDYIIRNEEKFEKIGYPFMQVAASCIKSFKKDNGEFLHYFNRAFSRKFRIYIAVEREDEVRGGMTVGTKKQQKARLSILKYAKARGLDLDDDAAQQYIADFLKMSIEEVKEIIQINEGAVTTSDIVKIDENGEEVTLFDEVAASSGVTVENEFVQEEEREELLSKIENIFVKRCQDRAKPLWRDIMTTVLMRAGLIDEGDKGKYSFYSSDIVETFEREKVTNVMIAQKHGTTEANVSKKIKELGELINKLSEKRK